MPSAKKTMPRESLTRESVIATELKKNYFAYVEAKSDLVFVPSGCAVMDAALGGGYAIGRVVNIVGDKSSGKTLKAMELIANFAKLFPKGKIRYAESEAAFDKAYARALGIPVDRIIFNSQARDIETVEDFYDDLEEFIGSLKGEKGLYILDSLDALSDAAELDGDFDEKSYGSKKPKLLGKLFRMTVQDMEDKGVMLVIISQLRDKINAMQFGEKQTRSGGRALDFYCSHIVWLAEIGKIKRDITIDGTKVTRIVGVNVKARVKKNKVGIPFREAEYPILFGYGIDDMTANIEWLISVGKESIIKELGFSKAGYGVLVRKLRDKGGKEAADMRKLLNEHVHREWAAIEEKFLPTATKY